MVRFLIGRGGAGKSGRLFEEMASQVSARPQVLIVPEQHSHRAERRLCAAGGNLLSLGGEVLTFTRLASRVFAQAGGLARPTLDQGGRVLLMYLAVRKMQSALTVYRHPSRKPTFLSGLLDTLDECKSYAVSPDDLAKAGTQLGGGAGDKLRDLGLILNAYDALCDQLGADPRDKLTHLAQALGACDWGVGYDFYLDGFTDFTPQQSLVLQKLMERANSVTFALTCDHLMEDEEGLGVFSPARKTASRLRDLARKAGQRTEVETLQGTGRDKDPALQYLEQNLFADRPAPWEGPAPVVCLKARDPRQEVEWTAAQILRLCREEGYRFRDVAVTARSFEVYAGLVDSIFPRFGIPVFLSRTQDILEKPVLALITGALDAIAGGYRYGDMFRYLKTGLTGIDDDQRDRLENYVLTWDIKGGRWTTPKPWHMHPGGYGQSFDERDEEEVAGLDALRRQIIAPLEKLRRAEGTTGRDRAMALYQFLEDIHLPQTLAQQVEALRRRSELNLADEYTQLWDILVRALESCGRLLAETEMDFAEFAQLFALTLSQYQVGTIPVALDRVTAGGCTRLGYESYKAVFFLGCDDQHVPACDRSPGLLTDDDRLALSALGLTLAPRMTDKLHREMTVAYDAVTLPVKRLFLTYPAQLGGEEGRPSFLVHRLLTLVPGSQLERVGEDPRLAAPESAMELAAEHAEVRAALAQVPQLAQRVERLETALKRERGSLSPAGVAALYGDRAPMSASRLDLYRSCHFSYFMRYGLRAQPRQRAGFDAPAYGTFVHAVLEEVLGHWDKSMTEEETRSLTHRAMERYLAEDLGGLEDKSPRFAYLFQRLWTTVERVVENVTQELRRGDFTPMAFELGFGKGKDLPPVEVAMDGFTVSLSGFVDRVDGWEHDGKLYLRVVDYKTGVKSFDFTDIFNGIGLQMLLYLFTLAENGRDYFQKEVAPAGVLYVPARDFLVTGSPDMTEAERLAKVDKALTRQGLLLGDAQVVEAMEHTREGEGNRFLPVRLLKDGSFSSENLASLEQLGKLSAHIDKILAQIHAELRSGTVAADPYWRGSDHNACLWCPYHAACQFEEGVGGDRRRWSKTMGAKEFWQALEGGEDDGLSTDR